MPPRRPAQRASRHAEPPPPDTAETAHDPASVEPAATGRRRFLGYLLAAPVLATAAELGRSLAGDAAGPLAPPKAGAAPANPQVADVYDLEDLLTDAARPTSNLISVQMNPDGTASFALPRAEVGQGITTAIAMVIAEEMDLPLEKVDVTLSDARPELMFNQLTGGTNTINSMFTPVRVAAALAKGRLLDAAAAEFDDLKSTLTAKGGVILSHAGQKLTYGELTEKAASRETKQVPVELKDESKFSIMGKPTRRVDALDAITGRKQFAMDMNVPDALPTMVARADTINGTPKAVANADAVRKMPGVTDVATISTGVAVRAKTFGQCIDAVRALEISWNPGPIATESDESVEKELKAANLPLAVPGVPGATVVEAEYTFAFASPAPLEPSTAIADVRRDSAEIWSSLKIPITAQGEIAQTLGLPQSAVKVHVVTGGGSFGRRLFHDAASDAAEASQAMGKPVKLMWHRTDECRHGRAHPMSVSKIRANVLNNNVVSFEQHHASVRTDFSHGFGELISATATRAPLAGLGVSETIFETTQLVPYSFGPTKQLLMETHQSPADNQYYGGFKTTSMRNVYSPNVVTAHELFVDKIAAQLGKDPYEFRLAYAKDEHFRKVLETVGEAGEWGKKLPAGMAQGIGVHREYKQTMACLVEIDCRPETVNRPIRNGVTGPRVTKVVFAHIPGGMVINPMGMEAQLQGGIVDGIAIALTSSLHLKDGLYLEGSWDDYFYTRHWNTPLDVQVITLPADKNEKMAGAGEAGVAPSTAATACAYSRAMGNQTSFWPINHGTLSFTPKPRKPSIPQSPTDGLKYAF
ncbi:MAG: molybdopterin-dependent oxidoreductase [Pseudonocardiaceae bacterium]|nr:molybdopterin-dependent oxidoreductase [Pseudonocardiaceae bacterium]